MIRSRVTFARTDAALMQAATRSPFHTASPGTPRPSTGNPSVRTYSGGTSSSATARRSASTFATCMPSRSHSSDSMTTTDQASAFFSTWAYTRSRAFSVSSLESASPGISPDLPGLRIAAPATSGPAHAPRPASSTPAISSMPTRRSARS